ncbi:MAG TPA: EAL domain-containing protein [Jatrophihabitans sp.]|nr:EAL domain-containing protein [Jatrophihabitans sp.]
MTALAEQVEIPPAVPIPEQAEPLYRRSRARRARELLPEGRLLPAARWQRRHVLITRFALVQALGVGAFGLLRHRPAESCLLWVLACALPALVAGHRRGSRRLRTMASSIGLMLSSAAVVDLSGGVTEAHFHFFVMIGVVALYQDWMAFGVCLLFVFIHHAMVGRMAPAMVFGGGMQVRHPFEWTLIHCGFVLAASVTHLVAWKGSEEQQLSDPLTQLPNRSAFVQLLDRRLADGSRPVSVLFVDLDNFKSINDSYGHHVGDLAIQHAASRMANVLREGDVVARLGGDEFAVLVHGDAGQAQYVGRRLSDSLQPPVVLDGREIFTQASIGVADSMLAGSRDSTDLLRDADLAMYLAKSSGKNQVMVYTAGVDKLVRERASLAADLRHALLRDQLELHYQPLVSADGVLTGVEALLRWHHPRRGLVPPNEFIQLAEETGDIRRIGAWVLRTAALQVARWQAGLPGCERLELAVNLSPLQLRDAHLVGTVVEVLAEAGLPPELLTLEVTESTLLSDLDLARSHLDQLRELGCRVAIDDFGTGYSSLSYLSQLPADLVKIDRSFVQDLDQYAGAVALVRGIIEMAGALGLEVLAEGVEVAEQRAILSRLGCPRYQGFLFCRPIPAAEFAEFAAGAVVTPAG